MNTPKWVASLCFLSSLALATPTFAQDDNGIPDIPDAPPPGMQGAPLAPDAPPIPNAASRVYVAEENALNALPGVLARGSGPGAVSLRASEEAFVANPAARDALLNYVSRGGTVFLHTGAAAEFGYTTVEAREGNNNLAGQLYGRARAAVPFGAHPLLWDDGVASPRSPNADPTQLPGVNFIYYVLRPGDHLVVSHPAGTPLLEVSDLAANGPQPLYAAAIAPFGRGFAVFTPDSLDLKRGDGALFARNLLGLLAPSRGIGRKWVGIPARVIEGGATAPAALQAALSQAVQNGGPVMVPALPGFGTVDPAPGGAATAPLPAAPPEAETAIGPVTTDDAQILISRSEANTYMAMLTVGGDRAAVATNLLRARLFLSRNDISGASRAVQASLDFAPEGSVDSAAVSLWTGIIQAGVAQPVAQSSVVRAQQLADAARNLAVGVRSLPVAPPVDPNAPPNPNARPQFNEIGLTPTLLQSWSVRCSQIAQVFSLEPPAIRQYGVGDASITLRGFPNDNTIELLDLGVRALANARNFGWRADREEILLFPTLESFNNYRRMLGLGTPTVPMPAGSAGDVLGQRIVMVAVPSIPLVETDQQTGNRRVFAEGNNTASVFARLHSYLLLNALDEGGTNVPVYLQLGLENTVSRIIEGPSWRTNTDVLEQFARNGGLLTPAQFTTDQRDPVRSRVAELQASGILTYLYNQYGSGTVVEIIQRLGAGQNINDALQDTTDGNEMDLFQDWRDAQFGPRRFPNRG